MNVEDALKLSTRVVFEHPAHTDERDGCVRCALLVLADEIQTLRLADKRMRRQLKNNGVCTCGRQLIDGICGDCNG